MIKGIIFDLDGVLINSEPVNIKAAQKAFAELGHTLSDDDLALIPGRHSADYAPIIVKNNNLSLSPGQVAARCHELYTSLWQHMVVLMPGAQDVLTLLKLKDITLALVTSSNNRLVAQFLQKFGFEDIFFATVSADDVTRRKPHPEPYLKAVAGLSSGADSLVAVEDTTVGVAAATAAGLRCIAVPNEYTRRQDFSQAEYVLKSLHEILELV
jgi:HAD superfamily hydrolase (TIGR01509 family)